MSFVSDTSSLHERNAIVHFHSESDSFILPDLDPPRLRKHLSITEIDSNIPILLSPFNSEEYAV